MRRLMVHSVGVVALSALMVLLGPSPSRQLPYLGGSGGANLAASSLSGHAATPLAVAVDDGRWKLGSDGACYWDPDDSGPDQCSQTSGRWKLGGDGTCYWDADDSGANQCEPPAASAPVEASTFSRRARLRAGA
jgi:hypothetical protein